MAAAKSPNVLFYLAGSGAMSAMDAVDPQFPTDVSGLPAFYYWKDALVVGSYIDPAGRFVLDITRDTLDGYAHNFSLMKAKTLHTKSHRMVGVEQFQRSHFLRADHAGNARESKLQLFRLRRRRQK